MPNLKWWQNAVFYQIYPRSFDDGNGDGIGDLQGMIAKLDYLKDLGIDAIWLSPHYPSPQIDCGYDVSDYTGVAPEYGSLDEFRQFLDGCHARGMRLILDLVLNHTSDLHPWFQESRSSRAHPRRDWYIWRDGKDGGPPNNWYSIFGGSAWTYDEGTGQYYYHFFFKEQPDLNWRNPEVKRAMFAAVRFWLDLGVDGFRLDAIGTLYEHPDLPDHTSPLTQTELYATARTAKNIEDQIQASDEHRRMFEHQIDLPGIHNLMQELRALSDEYDDRMLVGETDDLTYYGDGSNELHMVFNFPLMRTERLTATSVRANQKLRLAKLPPSAWPCNTLGNHDSPRVYSRFADGEHDEELARLALALLLTLQGTPFLYYGEEIGMKNCYLQELGQVRDTLSLWAYKMEVERLGASPDEAFQYAIRFGRDKCRTPMQWSSEANGGFSPSDIQPWLPVNSDYAEGTNVETQEGDPGSLLNFYRKLLHLRRETPALTGGVYLPLGGESPDYYAFLRKTPEQTCLVVLNFSARAGSLQLDGLDARQVRLLFASRDRPDGIDNLAGVPLAPFEFFIAEL